MIEVEKQKYYWKVVKKHKGCYSSSTISNPQLKLLYKIGKRTIPRVGKIFVFYTRQQARAYRTFNHPKQRKILKVKSTGKSYMAPYRTLVNASYKEITKFWSDVENSGLIKIIETPIGTCYVDGVIPIEESR